MVSPGEIIQLLKDDKGFLWLLSPTKVQRYDGKHFFSFSFDDRCISIQQDAEGVLWLASRQNIYRFKNDYSGFENIAKEKSDSNQYLALSTGPGKQIYLLTKKNILHWNPGSKSFDKLDIESPNYNSSFPFLKSAGNFLFYQKNDTVLARYNTVLKTVEEVNVYKGSFVIPVNEDSCWVRQSIGNSVLVSFKSNKKIPVDDKQIAETFNNKLFFVTGSSRNFSFISINDRGYYMYNVHSNTFVKLNVLFKGLPLPGSPPINSFYQEENGTIWFTNEEGLIYFNPADSPIGLRRSNAAAGENWNNNVRSITEDSKGNIWFATANGFCRIDKKSGVIKTWLPEFDSGNFLNYSSIRSIGYSNDKIIVLQSEKGCWIYDPATGLFNRPIYENEPARQAFEGGFNNNMKKLKNGNFLILSKGVWQLNNVDHKIQHINFTGFEPLPRTCLEDTKGRIWFVGGNGIFCCDQDYRLLFSIQNKDLGRWLNAIVQIDDTTFWVASKKIYKLKISENYDLSITPLFTELNEMHFSNFYKDSLHHIWMFADNGIYRYMPENNILEKFGQKENAQQYYLGVSNCFRASDGILYAGSINGINYFRPEKIRRQSAALNIQLLNVSVNQDDTSYLIHNKLPVLKYFENSLVFEFVAPHIYNGDKVIYRCRLQNADKDWIYLNNDNLVRYTALKPGKYTFHLAASLNGNDWHASSLPFSFTILSPFWKQWWFITLCILILLGLGIKLYRRRIKNIRYKEVQKTELEKLKAVNFQYQLEIEQVINFFATSINEQSSIDDMLWDVAKNCISKLGFEDCVIYLKDEKRDVLIQKAAWGAKTSADDKIINAIEIPIGKGIVGSVAQTGKAEIIEDTSIDTRYIPDDANRLSEIAVPITDDGNVIGVIDSEHPEKNFYTQRHLQILTTVASLCSEKIDKMKAEQFSREKQLEVLQLNSDLANSQLTALRAQMNPHFIFNALNSIQQFVLEGNADEANRYLSRFSKLQREILNNSDQQFIPLEKEKEILEIYLELEQLRFKENFNYSIRMDDTIDTDEIMIPPMIVQPFVENAIWHGLMPKPGNKEVSIDFHMKNEAFLVCTITDNGIGRAAASVIKANKEAGNRHASKGLSLVYDRLKILEKQFNQPFEVSFEDLYSDTGAALGTTVTLLLYTGYQ